MNYVKWGMLTLALAMLVVEGVFVYRWYDRYYGYDATPGAAAGSAVSSEETTGNAETVRSLKLTDEQKAGRTQQRDGASQREEAKYVGTVGDIQTKAVKTFLKSHDKLLHYDALTAADVQELKATETALQDMAAQAGNLAPPRKYEEQHKVFDAAIDELREAARLAHGMAADPVAASAEHGFDEYDGHVNEASTLLQRSNELLDEDYETIEGVREINPEF